MNLDSNIRRLQMKRKQSSHEEGEPTYKLPTLNNTEQYRTAKRRREIDDTNLVRIKPPSPTSSESADDDGDDFSSEDDSSFWGSDESEDERTEEITSMETNKIKAADTPHCEDVPVKANIKNDNYKLFEEEQVVLAILTNYWTSQVATKASKELGYTLIGDSGSACNSPVITKLQLRAIENLMSLPCVVSVGIRRDGTQVNVTVSDRRKALELSKELSGPNINLIEARNTHFI